MPTNMKFSDIVQEVISLARAANEARFARGPADSPLVASGGILSTTIPGTKTPRTTPEERCLGDFLEAQSPSVVYMLTSIMYLGRGDFGVKSLRDQYADVSETFGDPRWAAKQMLEKL